MKDHIKDDKDDDKDDDDDAEFGCRAGSLASKEPAGLSCLTCPPSLTSTRATRAPVPRPKMDFNLHPWGTTSVELALEPRHPASGSSKNSKNRFKFTPLRHHKWGGRRHPWTLSPKMWTPEMDHVSRNAPCLILRNGSDGWSFIIMLCKALGSGAFYYGSYHSTWNWKLTFQASKGN